MINSSWQLKFFSFWSLEPFTIFNKGGTPFKIFKIFNKEGTFLNFFKIF